jgi:hypothetical protein
MSHCPEGELSSWKEIAAYLRVGVRTAQAWERERDLPVLRLPGGRGRVLASIAELEAWKHSASGGAAPQQPPKAHDTVSVSEPPVASSSSAPNRFPKRRALAIIMLGIAVVVVCLAARSQHGRPYLSRVERDALIVSDESGRELWRKAFPYALIETGDAERAARYSWVGDLDNDGHNEVLFAPHPITAAQESTQLICYNSTGGERWRFKNDRRVRSSAGAFSPVYGVARFLVVPLGKGRGNAVLVSTTHAVYYPSQVSLLSSEGRLLREYWHSGHLNYLQTADLNGDGRPEFYLAGINNARHSATVVVLDEAHFGGASQEPQTPDHQLLEFASGTEVARLLLPQTCLSKQFDPYNPVASFTVGSDEIVVQTAETIGPGAGVFHHLAPDLHQRRAVASDSYTIEHRRALFAHQLSGASCPADAIPDVEFVRP